MLPPAMRNQPRRLPRRAELVSLHTAGPQRFVVMGRVGAPHGVRGAVKVQALSADPASLLGFRSWWLRAPDATGWTPYRVASSRLQVRMVIAELEGIATREAAAALRGADVAVSREALPALAENEYYRSDLLGMTVVNRSGEVLGPVSGFVESGAHPIVRVAKAGGVERLIPWVAPYVDRVDPVDRRIEVDWPADY